MRRPSAARLPLFFACLLLAPAAVPAETGPELFEDGNRLFRDRLYWAALLRYEQALDAGFDSPLLHYNTGVAHYRARQFGRAREAFRRAATAPGFATVAEYNLGLTAMAAGERDTALAHFRPVRDQSARPELAALATRAIARLESDAAPAVAAAEPAFRPVGKQGGFSVDVEVGIGSDDNVFRSPAAAYVDRAATGNPTVTPAVQSGLYYPLDVTARYAVGSFDHEAFFASYRLAGRYYPDAELEYGSEYSQQLAFGSRYHRRSENRERKIESAFTIAEHDEIWYDRDDGSERVVDGQPAGDRFEYRRYGPELWARQSFSRLSFNVYGKGQIWNYNSVADLPEFDHEYLRGGLSVQYRFTSTSLIRVEGDYWTRRFGERPSYSLDGTQPIGNPPVRYDYVNFGATARQRITRWFWFGLRYARTERTDEHVGYNDYLRDSYGAELNLTLGDRVKLSAEGWYRNYDFIRAFAYNDPAAGRRTLETADARLSARWQLTDTLALVGSYDYAEVASNDARVEYVRSQYALALRWRN